MYSYIILCMCILVCGVGGVGAWGLLVYIVLYGNIRNIGNVKVFIS